jgi:hypothetical protein
MKSSADSVSWLTPGGTGARGGGDLVVTLPVLKTNGVAAGTAVSKPIEIAAAEALVMQSCMEPSQEVPTIDHSYRPVGFLDKEASGESPGAIYANGMPF